LTQNHPGIPGPGRVTRKSANFLFLQKLNYAQDYLSETSDVEHEEKAEKKQKQKVKQQEAEKRNVEAQIGVGETPKRPQRGVTTPQRQERHRLEFYRKNRRRDSRNIAKLV